MSARREQILADWICYTAEKDIWWVCYRPWSTREMSWAEWHVTRFAATGDAEELVRAARHVMREIDSGPASGGAGGGPLSSGG